MKKFWFIIIGVVILLVFLFLDQFGLDTKPGYGLVQIAGMVLGAALIIYGLLGKKKA